MALEAMSSVPERQEYVALMKRRALGLAPEMGSAVRLAEIIASLTGHPSSFLDIGCAAGHYLQSIAKRMPDRRGSYIGVDIDQQMINAASSAWSIRRTEFKNVEARFILGSVEDLANSVQQEVDVSFCSNAFMYFRRPQVALQNMLSVTRQHCIIRSYFWTQTIIVKRVQSAEWHPGSEINEAETLDENGEARVYDNWNIYSMALIESIAQGIASGCTVQWLDDKNPASYLEAEAAAGIKKLGPTTLFDGQEIVYPFFLPWRYCVISKALIA